MRGRLSPGQRARLAVLGYNESDVGRIRNTAPVIAPKDVPTPKNATELAEILSDPGKLAPVLASTDSLKAFVQAYADQQQAPGTDLQKLVSEQVQAGLVNFLRENGNAATDADGIKRLNLDPQNGTPSMRVGTRKATAYNPEAVGARLDKEFGSPGEFFRATWHKNPDQTVKAKMDNLRNAYSSVVPSDGGFLVPEVLRSTLLSVALESSVVRSRAFVVPMDSQRLPFPTIDATTNVGSVFGGMVGYWTEEAGQLVASEAKFSRVTLDAKKLTGYSEVPNELFSDSVISFSAFIEQMWPKAIAFFEDVAFMTGTGAGEPLGFLGAGNAAGIEVAAEAGQPATSVVIENIVKMYSRMLPSSLASAVWIVSPSVLPELFTMALTVGTGGSAVYLTNAAGPAPITILGRPVIVSEKASQLGTRGDIAFVDLGYYLIGDRQIMQAESSEHFKFNTDQTAFRIIQRVDGRPWLQSAITPANNGSTLSAFVELASR